MKGKIRSKLINLALNIYNGVIFSFLNVLVWRNHIWNPEKWSNVRPEPQKKMGAQNAPIVEPA